MKRLKRALLALAALIAVGAVAFAAGHDVLYRWVGLRAVERLAGVGITVHGSFDVIHALPLEIRARDVEISGAAAWPLIARVDALGLRLRVGDLLRRVVHIETLEIAGADVQVPREALRPSPHAGEVGFGVPVIEQMRIADLQVRLIATPGDASAVEAPLVEHALPGQVQVLRIDELSLGVEANGMLRADGRGSVDGAAGTLEGDFGSLEMLLGGRAPFPVEVRLRVPEWALDLALSGNVERPLVGEGMAFEMSARLADLRPLATLAGLEAPEGFGLEAAARMTGSTAAPRLEGLSLRAASADRELVLIEGLVGDAAALEGLDLAVRVDARESALRITAGASPLAPRTLTGTLKIEGGWEQLVATDVDLSLETNNAVRIKATGTAGARAQTEGALALTSADAAFTLSIPLTALGDGRPAWLDAKRTIEARAALRGEARALAVETLELSLPGPGGSGVEVTGRVPFEPGDLRAIATAPAPLDALAEVLARGAALQAQLSGPTLAALAPLTGPLPVETGPWTLAGDVRGDAGRLVADAVRLETGTPDGVRIAATGALADIRPLVAARPADLEGLRAEGTITAPSTAALIAAFGNAATADAADATPRTDAPDLGRIEASFDLDDSDGWSVPALSITVTRDEGTRIDASGSIASLFAQPRVDVELTARTADASVLLEAAGLDARRLSGVAFDGRGKLATADGATVYEGQIALGETRLETRLELRPGEARPRISGTISSPLVRAADVGLVATERAPEADAAAFWDQPIPLGWLGLADADVELRAGEIRGASHRATGFQARAMVENRLLTVDPFRFAHEGGEVGARLTVDGNEDPPRLALTGRADDLPIAAVHGQFAPVTPGLEGSVSIDADLRGAGHTPRAIGATLDGTYAHVIEDARLPGGDIDLLGFRATQILLSTLVGKSHTDLECAIIQFRIEQGLARSDALYVATPNLLATGTGTVNLRERTLDIVMLTRSRRQLLLAKESTLRIAGTLANPTVDADVGYATAGAAAETAGLVMVPSFGLPLAALSRLGALVSSDETSPCTASAVEAAAREPAADGAREEQSPAQ